LLSLWLKRAILYKVGTKRECLGKLLYLTSRGVAKRYILPLEAGCKTRKNSITFVDTFIGGTPEFMMKMQPAGQKEYFTQALEFMKKEVGEQNIISAIVHMDEKTPHMHLCFTPITEDNRLSAKEIIGNKPKLVEWQDKFHEFISQRWPELERGEPASETKREHIPVQLFKQAQSLDKQLAGIRAMLSDVNVFNVSKKREEILSQLARWLPKVQSFERQIDGLYMTNSDLVIGNNFLKSNTKQEKEENMRCSEKSRTCDMNCPSKRSCWKGCPMTY